ncbi:TspO/MBR family protein [Catenulispora subtropica]|uniref:Tryptophan-rich sensory protein n=1 Tax=Catenulispora subtropica TaxID=450798 RepID=A0ABP5BQR9_9ACTN
MPTTRIRDNLKPALGAVAAVAAAATAGALGTDPTSPWYQSLSKPPWQPPPKTFGLVWTPLYGLIAASGARVLGKATDRSRQRFTYLFATDLALNAGWCWLFFRAKRPKAALAELAALQTCNVALTVEAARRDKAAGAFLVPYVLWSGFAAALNTAIVRRNRQVSRGR